MTSKRKYNQIIQVMIRGKYGIFKVFLQDKSKMINKNFLQNKLNVYRLSILKEMQLIGGIKSFDILKAW